MEQFAKTKKKNKKHYVESVEQKKTETKRIKKDQKGS